MPRHHTITMGPYPGGTQGPLGPAKPNLAVFSRFGGKFRWENCPTVRGTVLRGPQNCFTGVPVSKKVLQCLLNHTKTPHNHYGTLPGGPHGTLGPAKSKIANCTRFQSLKKNTSRCNPQSPKNRTKIEIPLKGGHFIETSPNFP